MRRPMNCRSLGSSEGALVQDWVRPSIPVLHHIEEHELDIASSVDVATPTRLPIAAERHSLELCSTFTLFLPPPSLHHRHPLHPAPIGEGTVKEKAKRMQRVLSHYALLSHQVR